MKTRLLCLFCAVCLLLCGTLPALAEEYDPLYPEILADGHLSATSALLIEADSGEIIYAKNPDSRVFPASTTKIVTCYLALQMADEDTLITVSANAVNLAPDESTAKLAAGEQLRLIDLVYAAILLSGNDAATAIAEGLCGSVEAFAAQMNNLAVACGCMNTHFVNANGLHDENHYTTARDMAVLTRLAMQDETIKQVVGTTEYTLPKDNIYRSRSIVTGNEFILPSQDNKNYYEYSTGIKTGTTSAAGKCLLASASHDGIHLIACVFGAQSNSDRYQDAVKLMNYGFSQYLSTSIAEIYMSNPRVIDIQNFDLDDPEVGRLTLSLRQTDTAVSDLIVTTQSKFDYWVKNFNTITVTEFTREFKAPVTEGEVMGTVTYLPEDGSSPVVYELIASRSVLAREALAPSVDDIIADAMNDPNPFPRLTFEIAFFYIILPLAALIVLVRAFKAILPHLKRKEHTRTSKTTERYYR